MSFDSNCVNCPYNNQDHLAGTSYCSDRLLPPVTLEDNCSKVLLVFQSPGREEWRVGKAIQPTRQRGGTAGARILQSWIRSGRTRECFNIINAVQCFPGNHGNGDEEPKDSAVSSCANRMREILMAKEYEKIVTFGEIAKSVVSSMRQSLNYNPVVVNARHPNGGVTKAELDALW